jgi:hypothetical protein
MPLRGIYAAAYRGARIPEGTAPICRFPLQMPKCSFEILREPGAPLYSVGRLKDI